MANPLEELNDKQEQEPGGGDDDGDDGGDELSTPRLSLYSLPRKPLEPPGMLTPPLHSKGASVPFQWEEAPGKPRPCCHAAEPEPEPEPKSKPAAAGFLDLPPRLLNGASRVTTMPSSTAAVHDGPDYLGRALSFRKLGGSFRSPDGCSKRDIREKVTFGSTRWGFHRKEKISGVVEGSPGISLSVQFDGSGGGQEGITKVKITRVSRRRSFFSLTQTKSHLWASIYGGLKQVVPWRRSQDKQLTKDH